MAMARVKTPSSSKRWQCPSTNYPRYSKKQLRASSALQIAVILNCIRPGPSSLSPWFRIIHCPHQGELGEDIPLQEPRDHRT